MAKYGLFDIVFFREYNKLTREHQKHLSVRKTKKQYNRYLKELWLLQKHRRSININNWKGKKWN